MKVDKQGQGKSQLFILRAIRNTPPSLFFSRGVITRGQISVTGHPHFNVEGRLEGDSTQAKRPVRDRHMGRGGGGSWSWVLGDQAAELAWCREKGHLSTCASPSFCQHASDKSYPEQAE